MTQIHNSGTRPADSVPTWALRRHEVALILASWSVAGVIFTGQQLGMAASAGVAMPLAEAAGISFAIAVVWAIITMGVFSVSRRFPLDRKPRLPHIIVHAFTSVMFAGIELGIETTIGIFTGRTPIGDAVGFMLNGLPYAVLVYWLTAGVAHGMMFYRRYRQRDAEAAVLAARLAQAELQVLKSQLHPHFLFNALNTISALMHRDVKAADRMLIRLSELLRGALDHRSDQEVSLEEELSFLDAYLEIEKTRLAERLTVEVDVPQNMLDARVPHMILQPLVENAIRHGVSPRAAPGRVTIRARGRRGMLDLEVSDNGPGDQKKPSRNGGGGVGLSNTRARLEQMYGEQFTFEPKTLAEGGYRVALSIPFRSIHQAIDEERG